MGRIKGDNVECAYHGMTYERQRTVRSLPCARPHSEGSARAQLSHCLALRLVVGLMGDAQLAQPSAIFGVDHYADPSWGSPVAMR